VSTHDFRTTKITQLLHNDKADLKVVQNYVGHTNPATTLIYAKTSKDEVLNFVRESALRSS
jgi:integrase